MCAATISVCRFARVAVLAALACSHACTRTPGATEPRPLNKRAAAELDVTIESPACVGTPLLATFVLHNAGPEHMAVYDAGAERDFDVNVCTAEGMAVPRT